VLLALSIGLIAGLVKVAWPRFTWFGDNAESFFPLWHMVGTALRDGHWLGFDPDGFAGGNIAGEANYGIFNPVVLVNAVIISGFDELARASFLVVTEFLVLLGLGVRLLALSYGARRPAAFTAGLIVPFGGFTLYWDAGNWICGLMSITWVAWTWWAARRYASGAGGPFPAVVCGGLAVTVGYPYALLGVVVVLAGLALELRRAREHRRLGGLVVAGLCIGGITLLTYLPLLAALPVGFRSTGASVSNANYLSPSIADLLGLGSPTLLPEIDAWEGRADVVPSVYLSWLVLPLLCWVRRPPAVEWRGRLGLLVPTALFGLMSLGPDQVWMFRWPLRLVEYAWVGLAVCFAVLLSSGFARDHLRRRIGATAGVLGASFFFSWSSTPKVSGTRLLWTAVVGVLVAVSLLTIRRYGLRALPVMAVAGTLVVTPAQAAVHGWDHHPVVHDLDLGRVSDLAAVREATEKYEGTVLQLSTVATVGDQGATLGGRLTYGHTLAAAGHVTPNRYTGIGYGEFMSELFLDYRGSVTTNEPARRVFRHVPHYRGTLVDVLGIDTVVLTQGQFMDRDYKPREGWRTVLRDEARVVLQRREVPPPGPRLTPGTGVDIRAAEGDGTDVRISLRSPEGGTLLVNRLNWPGYRASTGDGRAVGVGEGPYGLLELTVPPGATDVHLE